MSSYSIGWVSVCKKNINILTILNILLIRTFKFLIELDRLRTGSMIIRCLQYLECVQEKGYKIHSLPYLYEYMLPRKYLCAEQKCPNQHLMEESQPASQVHHPGCRFFNTQQAKSAKNRIAQNWKGGQMSKISQNEAHRNPMDSSCDNFVNA